jgi:catechol 2,3-dioxygenase-like lactoylglutathione lyase family enzyme
MTAIGRAELVYLFVADMDRALAFYTDALGLAIDHRAGNEWAQLDAGPVKLGLHGTVDGATRPGGTVGFTVRDLETARLRLVASGVEIGHEGGGDRGPRFVEFADPDGNVLALFERIGPD